MAYIKTIMNTQENNRLIAEFEGYETYEMNGYINVHYSDDNVRTIVDTHYHSSWDWLMPVVEKINDLTDDWGNTNDFTIGNRFVWVDPHIGDRIFFSGNNPEDKKEPMISKVYRGVVEFIKQYNNQ